MTFDHQSLPLLAEALETLERGFANLPDSKPALDLNAMRAVLQRTAEKLHDNYPYQHPLYVGQMLKPPHPIARLAYGLAMFINPNNHALDGGRASSAMEKDAVAQIAKMFGWREQRGCEYLGHLCGGGTIANFEALWISRELHAGKAIVASSQAHYTHPRLSSVLKVPFRAIEIDSRGRMNVQSLERELHKGDVGTVVVTLGTTAAGAVDPLDAVLALRSKHQFRIHVDCAYGGYFKLARNLDTDAKRAFDQIHHADSIVVDPHKHGLQPYGCGCVLFRDPSVGKIYKHDSPYTYFSSDELHLGEISLECSRAGASAVALWATMQMLPLDIGGEFATSLESCRQGALELHRALLDRKHFAPLFEPQLDIVAWAVRANSASESSSLAKDLFERAARHDLHLALATFPKSMLLESAPVQNWDLEHITCLRCCVMKSEQMAWLTQILNRLDRAAADADARG